MFKYSNDDTKSMMKIHSKFVSKMINFIEKQGARMNTVMSYDGNLK